MELLRDVFAVTTLTLGLSFLTTSAFAQLPYGPDTCLQGYVWREAFPNDHVCVTPDTRAQAARDNGQAAARRHLGGGAYGPDTCRQGYVWREARPEDHVCVAPETRAQAAADNAQAAARRVRDQPVAPPPREPDRGQASQGQTTPPKTPTRELPSFWTTLPGMLTALGGLIGAIAVLVTAIRARH